MNCSSIVNTFEEDMDYVGNKTIIKLYMNFDGHNTTKVSFQSNTWTQ